MNPPGSPGGLRTPCTWRPFRFECPRNVASAPPLGEPKPFSTWKAGGIPHQVCHVCEIPRDITTLLKGDVHMLSIHSKPVGHATRRPRHSTGPVSGSRPRKPCGFWQSVEDFLLHVQASGRSTATIQSYKESLALLGGYVGEQMPLRDLSTETLNSAIAGMSIIGYPGGRRRSEATLNRHRSAFRGFFRWAFETGRIPTNPALLLHRARVESAPTPPITLAEARLFLRTIRRSNDPLRLRDEALFSTYVLAGLRRKEALLLDQSDYNVKARLLCIKNGKGGQVRTVPVVRALGRLLQ